jgi:hypothetical protein
MTMVINVDALLTVMVKCALALSTAWVASTVCVTAEDNITARTVR